MIELLAALAVEVAKYINQKAITEHADKIASLKKRLAGELAKGQESDDYEIESISQEIKIEVEAMYNTLLLMSAKK